MPILDLRRSVIFFFLFLVALGLSKPHERLCLMIWFVFYEYELLLWVPFPHNV